MLMKKSGSMPQLNDDADEDDAGRTGAGRRGAGGRDAETEGVLAAAAKKAKEAEDEKEATPKMRRLKKTPSIQNLYQSQEIETEFKMVLPPREDAVGKTKVELVLPGLEGL